MSLGDFKIADAFNEILRNSERLIGKTIRHSDILMHKASYIARMCSVYIILSTAY